MESADHRQQPPTEEPAALRHDRARRFDREAAARHGAVVRYGRLRLGRRPAPGCACTGRARALEVRHRVHATLYCRDEEPPSHSNPENSVVNHMPGSSHSRAALSGIFFALASFGGEAAAQSQRGLYYSTSVGVASGASTVAHLTGPNHPTRCDRLLYADPNDAPTDPECTETELDFVFTFEPESGLGGNAVIGYAFGALAIELEATQRHQIVHEAPLTLGAGAGSAITGKGTEWSDELPPVGRPVGVQGPTAVCQRALPVGHPQAGSPPTWVSEAASRARIIASTSGFSASRSRKDTLRCSAAPGRTRRLLRSGSAERREASASSTPLCRRPESAFQVLGGIEVGYSERVSFDLRARWVRVPEVDIDQQWPHDSQPRAGAFGRDHPVRVPDQLFRAGVHRDHGRGCCSVHRGDLVGLGHDGGGPAPHRRARRSR